MKPTIGRIVVYILPKDPVVSGPSARTNNGALEAAAVVVRVFDDGKINLKVQLDGPDTPWVTSVLEGTEPGTWHWPPRV